MEKETETVELIENQQLWWKQRVKMKKEKTAYPEANSNKITNIIQKNSP
jgi:hypothetical protein